MAIFPKLKFKPPKQAHHNLSHFHRRTMAVGPLYPIACIPVNSGDVHDFNFESLVNTQALLSPLYGSFRLKIEVFFAGLDLYVPRLWRNGQMRTKDGRLYAPFPTLSLKYPYQAGIVQGDADYSASVLGGSSVFSGLGFGTNFGIWYRRGAGDQAVAGEAFNVWNAVPFLMYLDAYRRYYVNRQEEYCYFMNNTDPNVTYGPNGTIRVRVDDLDEMFTELPKNGGDIYGLLKQYAPGLISLLSPQDSSISETVDTSNPYGGLAGLALRCHMPDKMNVILNSAFYDANVTNVRVNTTSEGFTVDQLVTAKKLWNSRNKDASTSGFFSDWIKSHFGVTPRIMNEQPTFCGSSGSDIFFEDIRATTNAISDYDSHPYTQSLGDKASSGKGYSSSRRFRIEADRPGYVMVLASLVPRVDYYQGVERFTRHTKTTDLFTPEFNGIGLQDVLESDLCADASAAFGPDYNKAWEYDANLNPFQTSVGKQPAFTEFMTAVNTVAGQFAGGSLKSWVLARNMGVENSSLSFLKQADTSAYIHPGDWNQPFADQQANAENFLCQFYIDHQVRSTVLKRLLPYFS